MVNYTILYLFSDSFNISGYMVSEDKQLVNDESERNQKEFVKVDKFFFQESGLFKKKRK